MQLLPEDFERLAPYFEVGFKHFPALGHVGIRKAVNGPFTFAPDGNPLVGPVRGLRNYWVACAVMAGFSQGGGIGLMLSRWMAENDPGQDIISMDVARFGAFATPKYTSVKVPENYASRFRLAYPNEELPAARPVRRSPIYDRLARGWRGDGRELWAGTCTLVCAQGRRAYGDADVSSLGSISTRARRMPGCAFEGRHLRNDELRQVRSHGPRRARMARSCVRIEDPEAGKAGARADAQCGRPARGRSVDCLRCRGSLPDLRIGLRGRISHAVVLAKRAAVGCVRALRRFDAGGIFRRGTVIARSRATPGARRHLRGRIQAFCRERNLGRLRAGRADACRLHRRAGLRDLDDAGLLRDAPR